MTSVICKTREHTVVSATRDHTVKYRILCDYQHGFKKRRPCETQLLEFVRISLRTWRTASRLVSS